MQRLPFIEPLKLKLKLIINKNTNKVLYAEAGKDFVDLLLHTLMKPLGFALKEDFDGCVSGGLANLFTSVADNLNENYFLSGYSTKMALRDPDLPPAYSCKTCVSSWVDHVCLSCKSSLFRNPPKYVVPGPSNRYKSGEGYVKGEVMYMITDDLVLKPLSTGLTLKLLTDLGVKDISCVQESQITFDFDKGMELVKAAMTSKTVLTDILLPLKQAK